MDDASQFERFLRKANNMHFLRDALTPYGLEIVGTMIQRAMQTLRVKTLTN